MKKNLKKSKKIEEKREVAKKKEEVVKAKTTLSGPKKVGKIDLSPKRRN